MTTVRLLIDTDDGLRIEVARETRISYGDTIGEVRRLLGECVQRAEQALDAAEETA